MDERSRELAAGFVGAYHRELSPELQGLREQLTGSLAVSQETLEYLRQQEADRRANYDLVRGFVEMLPARSSEFHDESVLADDAHEARQVHVHVLWLNEPYNYPKSRHGHHVPYYIVGRREAEGEDYELDGSPATDLLLCSARPGKVADALRIVTVRDKELEIAETPVQEASFRDLDPDQVVGKFDRDTGKMRISSNGGMRTRLAISGRLDEVPRWRNPVKVVADRGISVRTVGSYDMRLDDVDLASFSVFVELSKLATAFNKKDELLALLENYGRPPQEETDPAEAPTE